MEFYVTRSDQNISLGYNKTSFTSVLTVSNSQVDVVGNLVATGNVQCNLLIQTSDARRKADVEDADFATSRDLIRRVRPKRFRYAGERSRTHLGVIAQQLREVASSLVHADKDGMLGVNYLELHMHTLVVVQHLLIEVEKLKASLCTTT